MKVRKIANHLFHKLLFTIFNRLPIDERKITFITLHSNEFTGNNKAIYDELVKRNLDVVIKRYGMRDITLFNLNALQKLIKTIEIDYHIATAKYIIVNDYFSLFSKVKVRKGSELIQVWHAVGALKKVGLDSLQTVNDSRQIKRITSVHGQYDKAVVSAKEIAPIYAGAFGIEVDQVYPIGMPKADVFFDTDRMKQIKTAFFNKYTNLQDKKIILYAPTFRDDNRHRTTLELDLEYMYNTIGENFVVALKMHPFERGQINMSKNLKDFVIDLTDEEINDLLIIADYLISDYSTVIFEFAIMQKPMLFFAYDLEAYKQKLRGFYYDYEKLVPGPVQETTEEVVNTILENKFNYKEIEMFAKRFNGHFDGKASARFVDEVLRIK